MAVGALNKIAGTTIEVCEHNYNNLVRESEQLRILKNYARHENVIVKSDILTLIEAMEGKTE